MWWKLVCSTILLELALLIRVPASNPLPEGRSSSHCASRSSHTCCHSVLPCFAQLSAATPARATRRYNGSFTFIVSLSPSFVVIGCQGSSFIFMITWYWHCVNMFFCEAHKKAAALYRSAALSVLAVRMLSCRLCLQQEPG